MPVTLDDEPCCDPRTLYRQCLDLGLPTAWFGLPNAFTCPLGVRPGEGWLLMTRGSMRRVSPDLDFPEQYDLTFASSTASGPAGRATLRSLLVLSADCLTPGRADDDAACYLLRLADRRHLLARALVDRAFNMRHTLTRAWIPDTVPGENTPWTWEQVCQEVWLGQGFVWPGLPIDEPAEPPEDLEFWQVPALDALGLVLDRLGCALAYDPIDDAFDVVEVGADDPDLEEAEWEWRRWRVWDAYPLRGTLARIPFSVRVTFRKIPHVRGEGSPFYSLDRADPDTDRARGAGVLALPDDMEALYDAHDELLNGDLLEDRADERAADYFRMVWSQTDRQRRVYPLPLADPAFLPGRQVQSIRWADTASGTEPTRGMVTEVTRVGDVPRPGWPDVTIDPLTQMTRITGPPTTGPGGVPLFPAVMQAWDEATGLWVDRDEIWLIDAS